MWRCSGCAGTESWRRYGPVLLSASPRAGGRAHPRSLPTRRVPAAPLRPRRRADSPLQIWRVSRRAPGPCRGKADRASGVTLAPARSGCYPSALARRESDRGATAARLRRAAQETFTESSHPMLLDPKALAKLDRQAQARAVVEGVLSACTRARTRVSRSSSPSTRSTTRATRSGTSTGRRTASSTSTT
jgi:hypothetical protein